MTTGKLSPDADKTDRKEMFVVTLQNVLILSCVHVCRWCRLEVINVLYMVMVSFVNLIQHFI